MMLYRMAGALALVLMLPACATVVRGTKQSFVINSEPAGAVATLSTGETCETPCSLKLKRKHGFTVRVARDGYEPVDATVTSESRAGAIAGNILLGGIIGAGVDASNGSLRSLIPNPLMVKMVPVAVVRAPASASGPAPVAAALPAAGPMQVNDAAAPVVIEEAAPRP